MGQLVTGLVEDFAERHFHGLQLRHPAQPLGVWQRGEQLVPSRVLNSGHYAQGYSMRPLAHRPRSRPLAPPLQAKLPAMTGRC